MEKQNKIIEYLLNTTNPYQLKIGDMVVKMEYLENNKKFNNCILNILTQYTQSSDK